ncbi:MAG TPA: TonB-dependent receptor [Bacteroidales bacterium]|nr:TonB-dependent receptor [Bacteroidales bacterium]
MKNFLFGQLPWLILIILLVIPINTYAQGILVKGKVTSDEDGTPMPGINVVVKGTTIGAMTDVDGNYSINAPDGNGTLVFSFVGYIAEEIPIENKSLINVSLKVDITTLREVVVIGYGTQEKKDITGSVSQVKSQALESAPVYNLEQSLKARVSGIQVLQNSGSPGGRIEVRIRGGNSMVGSNDPLYVVDGFPIAGGIDYIDPSDIESIDILKDASSTAIYGARGANGVVIITTRRGEKGQTGRIEINSSYGVQKETKRYDVLNSKQYAIIANEWLKNQGLPPYFNLNEIQGEGTDWQDVVFRTGQVQNHSITFSGGGDRTAYSLSGNYFGQNGIVFNSSANRGNIKINLDHEVNKRLDLELNLTLGRNEVNQLPMDNAAFGETGQMNSHLAAPPTLPVYDENGDPTRIEHAYFFASQDMRNPVIYNKPYKNRNLKNSILGNTSIALKIIEGLKFTTRFGFEYYMNFDETFVPIIFSDDKGSATERYNNSNSFLNENTLHYLKTFNNHRLDLVGGITYQSFTGRYTSLGVSEFPNNITENYNIGSASVINIPSNNISEWKLLSGLARINYSYDDKYLITVSMRADGSSRFGENNKWGYFPSAALGWRMTEEPFMESLSFIYDLKLRGSYGITGNTALSPYQSLSRLGSLRTIYGSNTEVVGYAPSTVGNPSLRWETTAQYDIGFDLSIFTGAIGITFDYYRKVTSNLLAAVPLPPSMGFTSTLKNVGEMGNKGIEFAVNANVLKKTFKWDIYATISRNKNKILELEGGSDILGSSFGHPFNAPANLARVGESFGVFYGLKEDGLTADGSIKYVDISGPDGVPDGIINTFDRAIIGSPHPKFIYGLNHDFSYKNFSLNIFFEGVYGNDIFWATAGVFLGSYQRGHNQLTDIMGNYWTAENPDPNAKFPKISSASNAQVSDRYIKDGSYLRVKTLVITYNIPVGKIPWINKVQVYFSGNNLFTFTNYPGLDPEVNTRGSDASSASSKLFMGVEQNPYPFAKTFSFGTRLMF